MSELPLVTVAICTHNRAAFIAKAIDSVRRQTLAPHRFDLLVVDNASTDATPQVLAEAQAAEPRLRVVREDRLGLSHARNRALAETRARYIAYLDDDAIAPPDWLGRLLAAFEQRAPVAVGGPVRPIWGGPRPPWLHQRLQGCLTVVDWGERAHALNLMREFIAGANMAFEREALEAVGGFDTGLGRVGGRLLSGEEILVLRELERRGGCVWYEPEAEVQHYVPAERLDKRWFYQRYFWDGISQAVGDIRFDRASTGRRVFLGVRQAWRTLKYRTWLGWFSRDETRRLTSRLETLRHVSKCYGYLRFR